MTKQSHLLKTIGCRVRKLRKELGWSQLELAERLGCSSGYISQIERGLAHLSVSWLMALTETLGISVEYLVVGAVSPSILCKKIECLSDYEREIIEDLIDKLLNMPYKEQLKAMTESQNREPKV